MMKGLLKTTMIGAMCATVISACSGSDSVKSGDLTLTVNDAMQVSLASSLPERELVLPDAAFSDLILGGEPLSWQKISESRKTVSDEFGKGKSVIVTGEASSEKVRIRKELTFTAYAEFPSMIVSKAVYTNLSDAPVSVKGWTAEDFDVVTEESAPALWSFQGQSTSDRADWIFPIGDEFSQKNYMGMNDTDYGGGVPVSILWRRDAGVIVGHLAPNPELVSLPVTKRAGENLVHVSVLKEYDSPVSLEPGASLETLTTFVGVFSGDCFKPLREYSSMLEKVGVVMPESEPSAFEPSWCAWGYGRNFTVDEVVGTLPKVKELGFRWATLDDGFQIAEGDWDLNPSRFPGGDDQMRRLVDEIHAYGLKAELWWAPMAADPGTDFLKKHPDALVLDKEGKPEYITWWDSQFLSPLDPDVRAETERLVRKFICDYGFDGLKLDGQHMNSVAPDYNPAHHPDDPEKCVREIPSFYKLIFDTAREVRSDAVIQYCPCGDCYSVYHLPYTNKTVSSDPLDSRQIRSKGYVLRALAPETAYYGDHIELSDNGCDWPTQLGIGAVIGTKFTWPKDNPRAEESEKCLLTPEREALMKNAIQIYNSRMLSLGEYVPGLYDIGYDYPETHVILKDGVMHYAFYATDGAVDSVELRGLKSGVTYKVEDYYNHRDLGTVTADADGNAVLNAGVDKSLLIAVTPSEGI